MGSAHVIVKPEYLERLKKYYHTQLTFVRETDFGDGTILILVETPLLDEYKGVCDIVETNNTIKFRKDVDI